MNYILSTKTSITSLLQKLFNLERTLLHLDSMFHHNLDSYISAKYSNKNNFNINVEL